MENNLFSYLLIFVFINLRNITIQILIYTQIFQIYISIYMNKKQQHKIY